LNINNKDIQHAMNCIYYNNVDRYLYTLQRLLNSL